MPKPVNAYDDIMLSNATFLYSRPAASNPAGWHLCDNPGEDKRIDQLTLSGESSRAASLPTS